MPIQAESVPTQIRARHGEHRESAIPSQTRVLASLRAWGDASHLANRLGLAWCKCTVLVAGLV